MGESNTHSVGQSSYLNDIRMTVENASKVIVPLSPISVFAARSPWSGLEEKTFDEVASWLKQARKVDIYPARTTIIEARQQGEISDKYIERRFQQWIKDTELSIPKAHAIQYGHQALKLQPLESYSEKQEGIDELVEDLTESLKGKNTASGQFSSVPLISTYVFDDKNEKLIDTLDYHVIKWCKLFIDDAQSGWTMPNRDKGLFNAWQRLVPYDPALTKQQRTRLQSLPNDAESLLKTSLNKLGVKDIEVQTYLENHLLSLPGWAGMMMWQDDHHKKVHDLLFTYLAIRVAMEWAIVEPHLPVTPPDAKDENVLETGIVSWLQWGGFTVETWRALSIEEKEQYVQFAKAFNGQLCRKLWLEAWEETYNEQLKDMIVPEQSHQITAQKVEVQMAFCIDVRSEPFRRQVEAAGPFETLGIAGFFGLPIEKSELGSKYSHPSLPVMNQPQHKIQEYTHEREPNAFQQRKHALESVTYTFKKMKQNVLPSLLLPELSGPWLSLQMLTRSFVPRRAGALIRKFYSNWLQKPQDTALTLDGSQHHNHQHLHFEDGLPIGFTKAEKVNYTLQALKLMDLTKDFAPLVVMCGHGSQSANNPYAASLDCGACGGAASGFNAKVLAHLCNMTEVRESLLQEGIEIPEKTIFAAAEHQTSLDELKWIYLPELSQEAQIAYDKIEAAMPQISYAANEKRLAQLPNNNIVKPNPVNEVHRITNDWSEIRPEWGLAKNAAFIIGQRELTKNSDLAGRAFLHNYDWQNDKDGSILANIIAGPALVAQWINLQYYASTVAPHFYGSGSKATQTVTAGIGVMQGNASDLLTGLPWQSVMASDNKMYHSPIRLLIVIQAPQSFIKNLLDNDPDFNQKIVNGWVRLASVDEQGLWHDWTTNL